MLEALMLWKVTTEFLRKRLEVVMLKYKKVLGHRNVF